MCASLADLPTYLGTHAATPDVKMLRGPAMRFSCAPRQCARVLSQLKLHSRQHGPASPEPTSFEPHKATTRVCPAKADAI